MKKFFDQALQGQVEPEVIIKECEEMMEKFPDINRTKLIIKVMKILKGKTNAAQIAKVIYVKGYFK